MSARQECARRLTLEIVCKVTGPPSSAENQASAENRASVENPCEIRFGGSGPSLYQSSLSVFIDSRSLLTGAAARLFKLSLKYQAPAPARLERKPRRSG